MSRFFIGKIGFSISKKQGFVIEKLKRFMPSGARHTIVIYQLGGWKERKAMQEAWLKLNSKG